MEVSGQLHAPVALPPRKVSVCLTTHHTMKTYWGSGGIAVLIRNLGARWTWVVSFRHRPFYLRGKSPPVPIWQEAGWAPEPVWTRRRRENYSFRYQESNSGRPSRNPAIILIQLRRISISILLRYLRGCIQKFPDWVDNEIYAYNNKHSLRSNTKGYGVKTHYTDS
jgi:hypothetical protein